MAAPFDVIVVVVNAVVVPYAVVGAFLSRAYFPTFFYITDLKT